jgi:hypothetical protein
LWTQLLSLFHTLVSPCWDSLQALSSWDFTPGHLFWGRTPVCPLTLGQDWLSLQPCPQVISLFSMRSVLSTVVRFPSHFSRECEEKSKETKRFLLNRLRKCKIDSFSAHPSISQQIQVRFYHSFFDTHSGFCFGFELLFWFAKNLGFEFCGLVILMWAPSICEASSERNRSWVCEEDTRLSSSCHFSLLMTLSFL